MKKQNFLFSVVILTMLITSGCVTEQQKPLGAKSNPQNTFSGVGIQEVRSHEGPISDMLVPDDTVLQLTEKKSPYEEGVHGYKRNIGLKEKGLTSNGVMNNRPGKIKELYPPHQTKILTTKEENHNYQENVNFKQALLSLETIQDVHIVETNEQILVGIESSGGHHEHQNKVEKTVQAYANEYDIDKEVIVTTKRTIINRMEAFENHEEGRFPFRSFKGMMAEFKELFR
ncbi:YhcN/YlaJ family sporulation lipoprotein [Alkalihalobacillus pseudalcaliphilus]|uniref:YhcN/YlaJ family sporulation lipoprotein n=1 Tax=Alkalihalobacillus pseudalcaliphilus TaxID=79884 RepID=UPI00064DF694|nr:YhcN/YlaJ family sporulation lipoprotein [Alkalihalobacillus pseudalcaliphilus]KMK76381.1 hypothetical protein AB990_14395 [Alkalihalobacillus pseudalcaliphilus]